MIAQKRGSTKEKDIKTYKWMPLSKVEFW
jgi:hypothetical protein